MFRTSPDRAEVPALMTTRRDNRNRRPVRNALLKWQLLQDQRRAIEVQQRLMRMAAPSPSSSLGLQDSRLRRPRPLRLDPEEDALMTLIMEREKQEAASTNSSNQHSSIGTKPSKLQYPSVLPSLNNSGRKVTLRPTGQRLNAARDFYSPVRPRESSLSCSSSDCRQNLAFSRIKTPTPKRSVPKAHDQMKTPDRWRTMAMRSNQDELNESALRRWEEEDARQADRLLEKAAKDGDTDALWNDLFYGTKAARAKSNQEPEQPVMYSTDSFPEVFSRSRSNSHGSSCYEVGKDRPKTPKKIGSGRNEMLTSELSSMSTSEQTKQSTAQHSYSVADSNAASAPTSTQTIAEMLASMEKSTYVEPVDGDLVSGDDQNYDGSSGGGGDRERFPHGEMSAGDSHIVRNRAANDGEFPRWSVVMVVTCLVIGTGGFYVEELMGLMGLFSKRTRVTLSRVEQEHMRDRVSALQHDLNGFQLSTSKMEVRSQTVLTELRQHMARMRLDREKHQDILANEMRELRHHILHITHELVEKERESIQTQLEAMIQVQMINEENADDRNAVAGTDINKENKLEVATPDAPKQVESSIAAQEPAPFESAAISSVDTELARKVNDGQYPDSSTTAPIHVESYTATREHVLEAAPTPSDNDKLARLADDNRFAHELAEAEQIVVPAPLHDETAGTPSVQTPDHTDSARADSGQTIADEEEKTPVRSAQSQPEEQEDVCDSQSESVPQDDIEQVKVERVEEVVAVPVSSLDHGEDKIDVSVSPAPKVAVIAKPPQSTFGMSWDGILLLIGIMLLVACVVLRVHNINRRKKWFEARRQRRNMRALLLAQQRARAMAETVDDTEDEWDDDDSVEEVSLMTSPVQNNEEDKPRSEPAQQSPETEDSISESYSDDSNNHDEPTSNTPAESYRQTTTNSRSVSVTEQRAARTRIIHSYTDSRKSPLLRQRRQPTLRT